MQHPSFDASPVSAVDPQAAPPGESIRFGPAIRFAFSAERPWMNILVSTVLSIVPVAGPIAIGGWHAEIMQRLVRRDPKPIPTLEFNDFTHYLSRGVQPFVARIIVALPLTFVWIFGAIVAGVAGSVGARSGNPEIVFVVWGIIVGAVLLLAPFLTIVFCAVYTRADLLEELTPTLKLSKLTAYMRATWATVLWNFFLFSFVSFGIILLGLVACYFGLFIASAVVQLGQLHLRWQIYERYVARGGEPIEPHPRVMLPSEQARINPYAPYAHPPQPPMPAPPYAQPQQPTYGQPPYPPR